MKTKDIIFLVLAGIILVVAGTISFGILTKNSSKPRQATVEIIEAIKPGFDNQSLQAISDMGKARDFSTPIDLSGLGNANPFD